jgi:hypothetical protein
MTPETLSHTWLANQIRLSVFPTSPWELPADLWSGVVGEAPETDQSQPRVNTRTQSGSWHGGVLQVATTPLRADWVFSPSGDDAGGPQFSRVADVLPPFVAATRTWLTTGNASMKRIAFGISALVQTADRVEAYELLQLFTQSLKIDPKASSDLSYRINHPVSSQVIKGLRLNRLTTWTALLIRPLQLQLGPSSDAQVAPGSGQHFAMLECDINTPAEHAEPLDLALLGATYDELVQLALENLERGEVI